MRITVPAVEIDTNDTLTLVLIIVACVKAYVVVGAVYCGLLYRIFGKAADTSGRLSQEGLAEFEARIEFETRILPSIVWPLSLVLVIVVFVVWIVLIIPAVAIFSLVSGK